MGDLFDAAQMYDEDYLYFFAAPGGPASLRPTGLDSSAVFLDRARRVNFVKRLFGFPEIRDWLLAAGFATVAGYGEDGLPLTASHRRMIVVAGLPPSPDLSELRG
jgi:hypothetical protein